MSKKKILIPLIIFSTILTTCSVYTYQMLYAPNFLINSPSKRVIIHNDINFKELSDVLIEDTIVNDILSFSFLSKVMDYQKNIKEGSYVINSNMSNYDLISMLRSGNQTPVNITFSYARKIEDLATIITKNLKMDKDQFLDYLKTNEENLMGYNYDNIITIFLPDTYQVYWNISEENLIKRMKREYSIFWNQERKEKLNRIGLNLKEFSTLASIVSSETNDVDEAKKIAGVYINRLKNNWKLQSCPTLIYASNDFNIKRVLTKHINIESPYNTYKYKGLPPGPIKMTSKIMIDATLNYRNHKYFFFCLDEDFSGRHVFSTNLKDHNIAARKIQNQLNKRKIY